MTAQQPMWVGERLDKLEGQITQLFEALGDTLQVVEDSNRELRARLRSLEWAVNGRDRSAEMPGGQAQPDGDTPKDY